MDPLAFHREALGVAQRVVDDIDRSHFDLPTPCDAWNVRQVLEHMVGGNRRIAGDPPNPGEDVLGEVPGWVAVLARSTDQLAHAWDLAKATGVSTDLAPAMYTTGLELLQLRFASSGRNPATYADETQPADGATAADRFAAFAGRRT